MAGTRDHGGDLDRARAIYGGQDWIDLSTGINPVAYPMPDLPAEALTRLPSGEELSALEAAAAAAYGTATDVVALSGAQAVIQLVPRLRACGHAAVLSPSYNEHAAALRAQGWRVSEAKAVSEMEGADLAVVVNPNNPDGRQWTPDTLTRLAAKVGFLVVDESFADPHPDLSLCPLLHDLERVLVMRSFGKFYGLAGVRLGFAIGSARSLDQLRALAGPWAVSGPAIAAGRAALNDDTWRRATTARLLADAARLDQLGQRAGWQPVGGCALFRTFATDDAYGLRDCLAKRHIWTRAFPYNRKWLRLGLPGNEADWSRLERAIDPLSL